MRVEIYLPIEEEEGNNLTRARRFVSDSNAFEKLIHHLYDLVHPTLSSKIINYTERTGKNLVKTAADSWVHTGRTWAMELYDVRPDSVRILSSVELSLLDRIKLQAEGLTGGAWDWWPLKPPLHPLEKGFA